MCCVRIIRQFYSTYIHTYIHTYSYITYIFIIIFLDVTPLKIGEMPSLRQRIYVAGFPIGGEEVRFISSLFQLLGERGCSIHYQLK
jgi:hypothetical protein